MPEHTRRAVPNTAAAAFVVLVMVLGAFSLWTVIPYGWIWIGSKLSNTQQPSGGPYMVVFVGIVCSIIAMAWILSRLNQLYGRIMGTHHLPRYRAPWLKSMRDERAAPRGMTVLEAVILASVLMAGAAMMIWFFVAAGSPLPDQ
ncbi:MAG: hypothetical protein M3O77_03420 [Chloroflexota bacterium]|nr:hypothetical protein [Chloroflexota bacterium]